MLTEKPQMDPKGRTWCYNLTDTMWVAGGAINNGGMILRWMTRSYSTLSWLPNGTIIGGSL